MIPNSGDDAASARSVAERFVAARLSATPLADYPGSVPADMDSAYRCQDEAIALWPDEIAGWKVGWIGADQQRVYHEERVVGPIFLSSVRSVQLEEEVEFPVYEGGFAAVEAEYIFRLAAAAPRGKLTWTDDEAAELVGSMHIGVEPASSPLATINDLGPAVVVSDFGNNAGLLVGPEIDDWRRGIIRQRNGKPPARGKHEGRVKGPNRGAPR